MSMSSGKFIEYEVRLAEAFENHALDAETLYIKHCMHIQDVPCELNVHQQRTMSSIHCRRCLQMELSMTTSTMKLVMYMSTTIRPAICMYIHVIAVNTQFSKHTVVQNAQEIISQEIEHANDWSASAFCMFLLL